MRKLRDVLLSSEIDVIIALYSGKHGHPLDPASGPLCDYWPYPRYVTTSSEKVTPSSANRWLVFKCNEQKRIHHYTSDWKRSKVPGTDQRSLLHSRSFNTQHRENLIGKNICLRWGRSYVFSALYFVKGQWLNWWWNLRQVPQTHRTILRCL